MYLIFFIQVPRTENKDATSSRLPKVSIVLECSGFKSGTKSFPAKDCSAFHKVPFVLILVKNFYCKFLLFSTGKHCQFDNFYGFFIFAMLRNPKIFEKSIKIQGVLWVKFRGVQWCPDGRLGSNKE